MKSPRLLDLFCKAGGTTKGYQDAGFYVIGVDIEPQPNYCGDEFIHRDAFEILGYVLEHPTFWNLAAIHSSPPCQAFSKAWKLQGNEHPDLITPMRPLLEATRLPYIIENVPGAPLRNPTMLCGEMFGLLVRRHRLFETNFPLPFQLHSHGLRQAKMGRQPAEGEAIHVVGNFTDVEYGRRAMGIDWMTRDELSEAIPPAYTEFIGTALLDALAACGVPRGQQ